MSDATVDRPGTTMDATPAIPDLLSVGVEEEFLLVDPDTGQAAPAVDEVVNHVPPQLRTQVQREFLTTQVEIGSAPVVGLDALARSLRALRAALAEAAEHAGVRLLAVGAAPLAGTALCGAPPHDSAPAPVVDTPRYRRMTEHFRSLSTGAGLNGLHVHVGLADRELGVHVLNHLRPWLPLLAAVTANSPFSAGCDTGYASWRSVLWNMWPSVGPTPYLDSAAHYDDLVARLVDSGVMLDDGMLYWYGRLSNHLPTVELRLGDVCPTVEDAILLAALVRGLVATVLADIDAGRAAWNPPHQLLTAAHWRAARDGLDGAAVDPRSGRLMPAWGLLDKLVALVTPALERHGDLDTVTDLLARLRRQGTGATRQREVARTGGPPALIPYLARATRG